MSNPFRSPQYASIATDRAAAGFFVQCDCGQRLGVTSAMAGAQAVCGCGRAVPVPRLSELRRMAGQAAYTTNAVEAARALVSDGHVPGGGLCSACGLPTTQTARFDVVCERTCLVGDKGLGSRVLLVAFAILFHSVALIRLFCRTDEDTPVIHGRDTSVRLPVWLCDRCQGDARYFKRRNARALFARIGAYAEIFQEYPAATVERVRSEPSAAPPAEPTSGLPRARHLASPAARGTGPWAMCMPTSRAISMVR